MSRTHFSDAEVKKKEPTKS